MPQMMPMSWLLLFLMFSMTFIMFNIMNYFTFNQIPTKTETFTEKKGKSMIWKW